MKTDKELVGTAGSSVDYLKVELPENEPQQAYDQFNMNPKENVSYTNNQVRATNASDISGSNENRPLLNHTNSDIT